MSARVGVPESAVVQYLLVCQQKEERLKRWLNATRVSKRWEASIPELFASQLTAAAEKRGYCFSRVLLLGCWWAGGSFDGICASPNGTELHIIFYLHKETRHMLELH